MRKNRKINDLRKIEIIPNFSPNAEGSCLIKCGETHVLCNASVDENIPRWLKGQDRGWITACLLYTSPSPRDLSTSRMPSSA